MLAVLLTSAIMIAAMHDRKSYAALRDIQPSGQPPNPEVTPQYDRNPSALLDAYRHVEVASVSDAIEHLLGKRMYLSHRMQPLGSPGDARASACASFPTLGP